MGLFGCRNRILGGMMADIIQQYDSDFGVTYVQVIINGVRMELNFNHKPAQEEIDESIKKLENTEVPDMPEPVQTKTLTVKEAIDFLNGQYAEIIDAESLTDEQAQLVDFMTTVKPINVIPIKPIDTGKIVSEVGK
jgi:hypothetical protein